MGDLEVKLVAEQARTARHESENERALLNLQSRIDALQRERICQMDGSQDYVSDALQDLQAVVNRQLLEEHDDDCKTDLHNSHDKQMHQCMASGNQVSPGHCIQRTRPRLVLTPTRSAPAQDKSLG